MAQQDRATPVGIKFNENKAGLDKTIISKAKIQETVVEASRGSKFFVREEQKDAAYAPKTAALIENAKRLRADKGHLQSIQRRLDNELICPLEAQMRNFDRVVVHVDMDSFYCAAELRERPDLKGKPVAVGGMSMLSTSSYEARKYGVRAAMPGFIAKKLCPHLIVIPSNFSLYTSISNDVKGVLGQFDPNFLMASLDEGYLDITSYCMTTQESPAAVTTEIRRRVHHATRLTCSAGVACNTLLAKIASDMNKPDGQTVLDHRCRRDSMDFLSKLPVRKIPGVGKRMESMLTALNINVCEDVYNDRALLAQVMTSSNFQFLIRTAALGLSSNTVSGDGQGNSSHKRVGISRERTFSPVHTKSEIREICESVCRLLAADMKEKDLAGLCLSVKLKLSDFNVRSRSSTLQKPVSSEEDLITGSWRMIEKELPIEIRLLGVRISSFVNSDGPDEEGTIDSIFAKLQGAAEEKKIHKRGAEGPKNNIEANKFGCPICRSFTGSAEQIDLHVDECSSITSGEVPNFEEDPRPKKAKTLQHFFEVE